MLNLTNSKVQEYRTAPCADVIDNSFVMKRVDDGNGLSAVAKATGAAGEDLVGIAHVQPIAATSRAIVGEVVTVNAAGKIALAHAGIIAGSIRILKADGTPVAKADIGAPVGSVVAVANVAEDDILSVSYRRSVTLAELKEEGLPLDFANNVNGVGGACEFATGKSTAEVDFFDTSVGYAVGAKVYANAEGLLTSAPVAADSPVFGTVAIAPTAAYPLLGVSFDKQF